MKINKYSFLLDIKKQIKLIFSILGILTFIFIILKLTRYVFWDWFWVFSPLLFPLGVIMIIGIIFLSIILVKG